VNVLHLSIQLQVFILQCVDLVILIVLLAN